MRIQNNNSANNALRQYGSNNMTLGKNLEKLSSGYQINKAGDDAAGLAISEKMRSQITGLEKATDNANDGISLVQTAEGALTEVHSMLNRMTELATQSANGTFDNETDRANLQEEVDSLMSEIDRISTSTNYNGINLLDGSIGGGKSGTGSDSIYTSATIAKAEAATFDGLTKLTAATDLSDIDAGTDTFSVDGQKLTIDWTKGDAKTIADTLDQDFSTVTPLTDDQLKDVATKLTDLFNSEIKEQGLSGEVKVTFDGTNFVFDSKNEGFSSEFSYSGTTSAPVDTKATSVGSVLFGNTTKDTAVKSTAALTYNGTANLAVGDNFNMTLNGVKVNVALAAVVNNGSGGTTASTMDEAATAAQTAIRTSITAYNDALGLTAGDKDPVSGLTGLKDTDFAVEANSNGQLVVKYTGDVDDVKFSFGDIGNKNVASALGLSSGSSAIGGGRGLNLQIGDTAANFNQISVSVDSMSSKALGIGDVDISTQEGAASAIEKIKTAINTVSGTRGKLGAIQNRLEHTINNLSVASENITEAESRIRDVDMAKEMTEYTQNSILSQASQAMLAQANQLPQGVLQLLQ